MELLTQCRQVRATVHSKSFYFCSTPCWFVGLAFLPKTWCYFHYPLPTHSWNIVGQNWEFWTIDVGKWHYKEWCIKCDNSLFICKFSHDWKNEQL